MRSSFLKRVFTDYFASFWKAKVTFGTKKYIICVDRDLRTHTAKRTDIDVFVVTALFQPKYSNPNFHELQKTSHPPVPVPICYVLPNVENIQSSE